jgi:hypothetical protein
MSAFGEVISSPALQKGGPNTVATGGSATGTVIDGLYSRGTYSGGTVVHTVTIADVITVVGQATRGGFPRGPRP